MLDKLPLLFEGHASAELLQAFDLALTEFEGWALGEEEPAIVYDGSELPISVVFGRLRGCTDLLPTRLHYDIQALSGRALNDDGSAVTYADAAQVLRAMCIEHMKAHLPNAETLSAARVNAARVSRLKVKG